MSYRTHDHEILISEAYGGFGFSDGFLEVLESILPNYDPSYDFQEGLRDDPIVIAAAKKFGLKEASGNYCDLTVKTIPAYHTYIIHEYDGLESVKIEFPWQEFALALYLKKDTHPLLMAVQRGDIVVPDTE